MNMRQHRAKVAEKVIAKNLEIVKKMDTKNLPKWKPETSQIELRGRQEGAINPKKPKKRQTQHKAPLSPIRSPYFDRKSDQHGSKLASKNEAKSRKKRYKKRSKKRCILESIF